jgi:hypothetical protein
MGDPLLRDQPEEFTRVELRHDDQPAVHQQGLISDPIDKTITCIVVFMLLRTLSRRFTARFPQGEQAVGLIGSD